MFGKADETRRPQLGQNDPVPSPPPAIPEPDWAELDEPRSPAVVAIHRELTNNGPLTLQELEAALVGRRVDVTEHDLDDLVEGEIPLVTEIGITDPPVYVALDHLLSRRVFTHRLTASEIESDVVAIEPDLVAMSTITIGSPFNRLEAGDRIDQVFARDGEYLGTALDLPTGALSDYRAGDLIGFSLGHGGLRIEPVGLVAAVPNDLPDRVHGLLRHDVQAPLILEDLFLQLCVDDPALFVDALPPVAEMLDDWDVEREGDHLAPSGFDFAGWRMD